VQFAELKRSSSRLRMSFVYRTSMMTAMTWLGVEEAIAPAPVAVWAVGAREVS
jgi:hypothetical protein